ncbi:phosphate ABC transporter, permease protein PstA [PVC group bacterium (ex Bugula neritina AB1)]|nr:phosphate ABC transporter, permease protein PstA [PVC group bacterium (ex Bugula neritina AB1)]
MKNDIFFRKLQSSFFFLVMLVLSLMVFLPLICILYYVISRGIKAINLDFFTQIPSHVGDSGGGVLNAIMGSFYMVFLSIIIAVPWGLSAGIFLYDAPDDSRFAYLLRLSVDIIQSIPSIVIGIVAYVWFVMPMQKFSALSGSFALAIMMLPMIVRSTEETLRLIPKTLKEASLALGVPHYTTLFKIMIPSGVSGILTGGALSIGRVVGETAPLIFTAFGSPYLVHNILKPMDALPLLIYNCAMSPYESWHTLAWGASLILIFFTLCINLLIKIIVKKWEVVL